MRQEGKNTKQLQENIITLDLAMGAVEKGRPNLPNEVIKASATILANKFLDYVRNGGDTDNLTPSKVFGRKQ